MPKNSSAIVLRNLARGLPSPNLNPVDGADGRNLGRGAGKEDLVGNVQHLARNGLLGHREVPNAAQW